MDKDLRDLNGVYAEVQEAHIPSGPHGKDSTLAKFKQNRQVINNCQRFHQ